IAWLNSPLPSPSMRTLPSAFCSLPHAPITNASLTEMQAMASTPFALNLSASATNPGTCFAEQVGVNAPGSAKATTFLPGAKSSSVVIGLGPSGPSMRSVALGTLSPTLAISFPPAVGRRTLGREPLSVHQATFADWPGLTFGRTIPMDLRDHQAMPEPTTSAASVAGSLVGRFLVAAPSMPDERFQ